MIWKWYVACLQTTTMASKWYIVHSYTLSIKGDISISGSKNEPRANTIAIIAETYYETAGS